MVFCKSLIFLVLAFPTNYPELTNPYNHRIFELKGSGAPLYLAQRHEMICQSHTASSPDTTLSQEGKTLSSEDAKQGREMA